jgi:putative transposase
MPWCRRVFIPGGTYFFSVTLEDRRRTYLTGHIEALHNAYGYVRKRQSFETAAIVVLPDHPHCVWTLRPDDRDFPMR